jgi:hypothetical protein
MLVMFLIRDSLSKPRGLFSATSSRTLGYGYRAPIVHDRQGEPPSQGSGPSASPRIPAQPKVSAPPSPGDADRYRTIRAGGPMRARRRRSEPPQRCLPAHLRAPEAPAAQVTARPESPRSASSRCSWCASTPRSAHCLDLSQELRVIGGRRRSGGLGRDLGHRSEVRQRGARTCTWSCEEPGRTTG